MATKRISNPSLEAKPYMLIDLARVDEDGSTHPVLSSSGMTLSHTDTHSILLGFQEFFKDNPKGEFTFSMTVSLEENKL